MTKGAIAFLYVLISAAAFSLILFLLVQHNNLSIDELHRIEVFIRSARSFVGAITIGGWYAIILLIAVYIIKVVAGDPAKRVKKETNGSRHYSILSGVVDPATNVYLSYSSLTSILFFLLTIFSTFTFFSSSLDATLDKIEIRIVKVSQLTNEVGEMLNSTLADEIEHELLIEVVNSAPSILTSQFDQVREINRSANQIHNLRQDAIERFDFNKTNFKESSSAINSVANLKRPIRMEPRAELEFSPVVLDKEFQSLSPKKLQRIKIYLVARPKTRYEETVSSLRKTIVEKSAMNLISQTLGMGEVEFVEFPFVEQVRDVFKSALAKLAAAKISAAPHLKIIFLDAEYAGTLPQEHDKAFERQSLFDHLRNGARTYNAGHGYTNRSWSEEFSISEEAWIRASADISTVKASLNTAENNLERSIHSVEVHIKEVIKEAGDWLNELERTLPSKARVRELAQGQSSFRFDEGYRSGGYKFALDIEAPEKARKPKVTRFPEAKKIRSVSSWPSYFVEDVSKFNQKILNWLNPEQISYSNYTKLNKTVHTMKNQPDRQRAFEAVLGIWGLSSEIYKQSEEDILEEEKLSLYKEDKLSIKDKGGRVVETSERPTRGRTGRR